jgi:lipopolysaccharide transport system ATP-binding protein
MTSLVEHSKNQLVEPSTGSETVLSVQEVSKKFCRSLKKSLFYGLQDMTGEFLNLRQAATNLRPQEFWALKQVNLQLRRGESLGLIGVNGSGKTTLLRIISGLIKPDTGTVTVRGRVAPLIALGAGFNPVLTGRENIFVNMSILGLSTREIEERFDDVVNFAGIGDAIDAPVHSYSSGMAARLGFASAIHTEPDILLIDEVLAVGDIQFLAKCHRRLHELREKGTSFVLVSHNPQAILAMCQQSIYLRKGEVVDVGETERVMNQYDKDLFLGNAEKTPGKLFLPKKDSRESLGLDITSVGFETEGGDTENLTSGEPVQFCVGLLAHQNLKDVNLRISIIKDGQTVLYVGGTNDHEYFQLCPGSHQIKIEMPYLGLTAGVYSVRVDVRKGALFILDIADSFKFNVQSNGRMSKSSFYQPRSWHLVRDDALGLK